MELELGEQERRQDSERIRYNIDELLVGNPQQEFFAIKHLSDSGEYAIPQMIQTLLDPAKRDVQPRVIRALPRIGKAAVNPLVVALKVRDENVRQHIIRALGEIGPSARDAVPLLCALLDDDSQTTYEYALEALSRIEP